MVAIVIVIVSLVIIIICREITCWYFKLNIIVDLLAQQNYILSHMADCIISNSQEEEPSSKEEKPKKYRDESPKEFFHNFLKERVCPHCGAPNIHSAIVCKKCGKEI